MIAYVEKKVMIQRKFVYNKKEYLACYTVGEDGLSYEIFDANYSRIYNGRKRDHSTGCCGMGEDQTLPLDIASKVIDDLEVVTINAWSEMK
jgi:hypothetical protein